MEPEQGRDVFRICFNGPYQPFQHPTGTVCLVGLSGIRIPLLKWLFEEVDSMKRTRSIRKVPTKISEKDLTFREIGKGFILSDPANDMPKGRRLITAYADQFDRSYIQVNGRFERITEQHSYLAVGW
jgi:hypothetical protein